MKKNEEDRLGFEIRDRVKIRSLYGPIDGKEGVLLRFHAFGQCDVNVDGQVHLLFLDQLTKLT